MREKQREAVQIRLDMLHAKAQEISLKAQAIALGERAALYVTPCYEERARLIEEQTLCIVEIEQARLEAGKHARALAANMEVLKAAQSKEVRNVDIALAAYDEFEQFEGQRAQYAKNARQRQARRTVLLVEKNGLDEAQARFLERLAELNAIPIDAQELQWKDAVRAKDIAAQACKDYLTYIACRAECDEARTQHEAAVRHEQVCALKADAMESAYLAAQAGLLAQTLQEGAPCPVCGATSHPQKALLPHDAPSEQTLNAARASLLEAREKRDMAFSSAERAGAAVQSMHMQLTRALMALNSGATIDQDNLGRLIHVHLEEKTGEEMRLRTLYERGRRLLMGREALMRQIEQQRESIAAMQENIEACEQEIQDAMAKLHTADANVAMAGERLPYPTRQEAQVAIEQARCEKEKRDQAVRTAQEAVDADKEALSKAQARMQWNEERLAVATEQLENVEPTFFAALTAADFVDEAAYVHALIAPEALTALREEVQLHQSAIERAEVELNGFLQGVGNKSAEQIAALEEELQEHKKMLQCVRDAHANGVLRYKNNARALQALLLLEVRLQDAQEDYALKRTLYMTANGTLPGVQGMNFERYMQLNYFESVLRFANLRLLRMSGGRYELLRRSQPDTLRPGTGLDIDVLDHFSGKARPASTLSGGESFLAALALALGLADVAEQYAGGVSLDAMFIDEGFGSLDGEALERAVSILEELTGNRTVGVISHVEALRSRIQSRIEVKLSPLGSHILSH